MASSRERRQDMDGLIVLEKSTVEGILQCPVCLDLYDEGEKLPKILSCHHTLCLQCLKALRRSSNSQSRLPRRCPLCRAWISIEPILRIPTNFDLLKVRGFLASSRPDANLDLETSGTNQLEAPNIRRVESTPCSTHEGFDRIIWCNTCDHVLCPKCLYEDHPPMHSITTIEEKRNVMIEAVETLIERVAGHSEHKRQIVSELRGQVDDVVAILTDLASSLDSYGQTVHENDETMTGTLSEIRESISTADANVSESLSHQIRDLERAVEMISDDAVVAAGSILSDLHTRSRDLDHAASALRHLVENEQ